MKKESFKFLKTLSSLENCIECVRNDVEDLLNSLPEDSELDRQGIDERAYNLKYWFNHVINEYDA